VAQGIEEKGGKVKGEMNMRSGPNSLSARIEDPKKKVK